MDPLALALAFEHRLARESATDVHELPWGFAISNARFPTSVEHNRVVVYADADPVEVLASTDDLLSGAPHREVSWEHHGQRAEASAVFVAAGYVESGDVVMTFGGSALTSRPTQVRRVDGSDLDGAIQAHWLRAGMSADGAATLTARRTLWEAVVHVEYLAVEREGRWVSHCELRTDGQTAQIENVLTEPTQQRQGLARDVMSAAVTRGEELGCSPIFLRTDADDWPQHFYERVGFRTAGHVRSFSWSEEVDRRDGMPR